MMNLETEKQAISTLVFELTIASSKTSDLDALLDRLFSLLDNYPALQIEQRGAILLLNPRGRYFQVAQFGIAPAWEQQLGWQSPAIDNASVAEHCQVQDIILNGHAGGQDTPLPAKAVLLPIHADDKGIGYTVLFARADAEFGMQHIQLFNDLARALSGLIQRALHQETLRIRELELEEARADAIRSLGVASEYRDNETGWHIMRMTNIAQAIAKALGLPEHMRELLYIAAPMHDVGKIGIADSVLLKPGKLTPEEFEIMKRHTDIGVTILEGNDELIQAARDIAGSHHERWDGKGYPKGLRGEQIPLLARICAIADVFDALTSKRPYKEPWTVEAASEWIVSEAGKHFDPSAVRAFQQAMPEILRIRELYREDIIDPKQVLTLPPLKPREDSWAAWDDSLNVGIDVIDEHHRYLFDLINDLHTVIRKKRGARDVARLIKSLDVYAKIHFRAEEQMMQHYGYEETDQQLRQHHLFENKLGEFYEELHENPLVAQYDALSYLYHWLVRHIQVEDAKLATLA